MNIVLVSIGNFQPYILDNIRNLIRLEHQNIYVIINAKFRDHFAEFEPSVFVGSVGAGGTSSPVKLVFVENLSDSFHFYERTRLDKKFNGGFWVMTSLRIFYLYAFMEKYHIENVIHIENDVVLYYNCDTLLERIERTKIYIPFNSFNINVISIVYIPKAELLRPLLMNWDMRMLDMNVFAIFKRMMPDLVDIFPIFKDQPEFAGDDVKRMVCYNFDRFGVVFDGNAMGQYLGGIDPQNIGGSTRSTVGFVNADCCIKYDRYAFVWKEMPTVGGGGGNEGDGEDGGEGVRTVNMMKKPFLCVGGDEIPIFNLHIHSKNLAKFVGGAGFS